MLCTNASGRLHGPKSSCGLAKRPAVSDSSPFGTSLKVTGTSTDLGTAFQAVGLAGLTAFMLTSVIDPGTTDRGPVEHRQARRIRFRISPSSCRRKCPSSPVLDPRVWGWNSFEPNRMCKTSTINLILVLDHVVLQGYHCCGAPVPLARERGTTRIPAASPSRPFQHFPVPGGSNQVPTTRPPWSACSSGGILRMCIAVQLRAGTDYSRRRCSPIFYLSSS